MASGNVTTRTNLATPQPTMLLYAGLSPFGTTDDRKITANALFAEITANITDLSVQFGNGTTATVSAANKGKIRYLDGTGFQVSENGAAYATITSLGNAATGTGAIVRETSPTLITPALGTPTALVLTSATGLPVATGISGLGSGVAAALAVNTGSAGAIVLFNGAAGTPSSLTLTNATGLSPVAGIVGWPANASGVLTNNGSGTLSWGAGGSTSPGGATTNAQYNNAGAFGGSTGITFTATQATITGAKFVGSLRDANDLILIAPTATASAVNYFTMANSAAGGACVIGTAGSSGTVYLELAPKGAAYPNGAGVVFPLNTRYDDTGLKFKGFETSGIGCGLKAGGAVFEITASIVSLGCNAQLQLLGPCVLAWGTTGVGPGGSGTGTANDDPPGTNTGIEKGAAAVLGFVGFSGNTGTSYKGGTWRARANTPVQITSNQNNYNPGGTSYYQRWSTDASRDITGLTFTDAQVDGQSHEIWNVGSSDIVLKHQVTSTAANQFLNSTGADITLTANQGAKLWYDGAAARWRVTKLN